MSLKPWDVAFVVHCLRTALYAIDEQEVRAYFPIERVIEGCMRLLKRLFGVRLVPRNDVERRTALANSARTSCGTCCV